ncbi:hypothetical protein BC659_0094 [Sediminibacterium goheungense]|uniref:DNA-binding protein n=1 Tax=Sediminibacterium goheungense TaxID=1086393 RepID=A0A4R6J1B0_9BACT|nr:hypothetical protein BC659_0094 [Sediminibacterium goheungense]
MGLFNKDKDVPESVKINGKPLICPHCQHNLFWVTQAQLNKASSTFWGIDWADKSASCFVCAECTRIEWFFGE